jgi:hypothetical protein
MTGAVARGNIALVLFGFTCFLRLSPEPYFQRLQDKEFSARIGNLLIGSKSRSAKQTDHAWVVERSKATGCKPVGLISYVGSNPTPCTRLGRQRIGEKGKSKIITLSFILLPLSFPKSGSSSVGRASAFQAECREFESRLPLQIFRPRWF